MTYISQEYIAESFLDDLIFNDIYIESSSSMNEFKNFIQSIFDMGKRVGVNIKEFYIKVKQIAYKTAKTVIKYVNINKLENAVNEINNRFMEIINNLSITEKVVYSIVFILFLSIILFYIIFYTNLLGLTIILSILLYPLFKLIKKLYRFMKPLNNKDDELFNELSEELDINKNKVVNHLKNNKLKKLSSEIRKPESENSKESSFVTVFLKSTFDFIKQ